MTKTETTLFIVIGNKELLTRSLTSKENQRDHGSITQVAISGNSYCRRVGKQGKGWEFSRPRGLEEVPHSAGHKLLRRLLESELQERLWRPRTGL